MKRRTHQKREGRQTVLQKLAAIQVQLREIDQKLHHLIENFRHLRHFQDLLQSHLNDYLD